ncbi:hypothetical protein C8K30_1011031 [Promicromonospora sp. AC04]|uniref:hypothetical protein n=1 Tax=Promicromonospora sp. AC04 TaxID=2135723 RepID=UPI000D33DC15|nr:hypothetical protein [Promicromonospora sp. AC04]PUB32505.1 hypothetical protein C8K30_1011031 [Promicromonospora sp. AC04]
MLSILIVGVAAAIVVVITFVHKGRGDRSRLLRYAVITMLIAAVLRELAPVQGLPAIDLLKRLTFLVTQTASILLMLTFRRTSVTRHAARRIWIATAVVGAAAAVLVWFVPTHSDGTLYTHAEAAGSPAGIAYYGLYEATMIVTALVVGVGCWSALVKPGQPVVARLSLVMIGIAAVGTVVYVGLGLYALAGGSAPTSVLRGQVYLVTLVLLLTGLAIGGLRKIVVEGQQALTIHTATDVIEPLWRAAVTLHPDVVLPRQGFSRRERLIRLVVETHDALGLVRRDSDHALDVVRDRYTDDPKLTAGLLLHLLGEDAVPDSPGRVTRLLMHLISGMRNEALMASIKDLYEIRRACGSRDQWWQPATV